MAATTAPGLARRLLTRWESLEGGPQAAIAFPILVVVISFLHWGPLSQPLLRGFVYGVFWAIPATAGVVVGTAGEKRKRRERAELEAQREAGEHPPAGGSRLTGE